MIQSLKIQGLFGLYSYNLKFRVYNKDSITFITGPNGYGKTTILSLIQALYSYNLNFLMTIPFDTLTFTFGGEGGGVVEIIQRRHTEQEDGSDVARLSSVTLQVVFRKPTREDGMPGEELDRFEAGSDDPVTWKMRESQLRLYMQSRPCYYIKDQRLEHKTASLEKEVLPEEATEPAVCYNAKELQRELVKQQVLYNGIFQTPPSVSVGSDRNGKEVYDKLKNELQPFLDKLYGWELIKKTEIPEYDPQNGALEGYLHQLKQAVEAIDTFVQRLDVFERIVKRSQFANKKLEISPRFGYRFLAEDENRTILSCEGLSSGEQHILIQTYELLFRAEEGSLALIDEPELSFHLSWQMDFLRNIREIMEVRDIQCIVGTHSPQVFSNKWELSTDLYAYSKSNRKK
ncbi:AAA family ATPase [Alistipes finegoldii]